MAVRVAVTADWEVLHRIRMAVTENVLSNPAAIGRDDYLGMLEKHGRGWVFEEDGAILGFAIADHSRRNVWALFVEPGREGRGIGRELLATMMRWMFEQSREAVWLTTGPGTRAEALYRKAGWREVGRESYGDLRLELSWEDYRRRQE